MIWPALLLAAAASAVSIEPGGYLKDVYQYSASAIDGRPYYLNTARARLSLDAKASIFRGHVDYDHEVLAGSYFRTREFQVFGLGEPATYWDADQAISTGDTVQWRHRLYRGWLGADRGDTVVRFGRQRIAWGTGKLWNPTDVLNPYQPLSVERDQRRGVDALYARQGFGNFTQLEAAWALEDVWARQSLLARAKSHWGEYDASLMGGKVAGSSDSWAVGGDFAGNLFEGTLHGEWLYRAPDWKGDVGYEYTFPAETKLWALRDAAIVVEYLHSGSGARDTARYDTAALIQGREVTLARDYFGFTYSKDVHALLKAELVVLQNADDGSNFFSPSLQWNALDNLYLTLGLQRFGGPKRTEFGRPANLLFAMAQYYF